MLEKVSTLANKHALFQRRCLFWTTISYNQQFIANHSKVAIRATNLKDFKLIHRNKLVKLKLWTSNLSSKQIYKDENHNHLVRNFLHRLKDKEMGADENTIFAYNSLDDLFLLKNVLEPSQSCLCTINGNSRKNVTRVNVIPLWGQNSNKKTLLFHENTAVSRREFSTVINSDDRKEPQDEAEAPPPSKDRIYTAPKNVLNNIYAVVAQELKNKDFKATPIYSLVKGKHKGSSSSWCCTYNINWPEDVKFAAISQTKQEASHKAATAALLWLKKNDRITKDGHPVIMGKSEIKAIMKETKPTLVLDNDTVQKLKTITDVYKNELVPKLAKSIDTIKKDRLAIDNMADSGINLNNRNLRQKVLPLTRYLAKEKVRLPISQFKNEFIDLLSKNRVVIIKGEPGCGKSTRIPQYVLESWAREGLEQGEPCRVAVTQPRRIAAISLADRVSDERDENCGNIVGYQIRLKSKYNPATGRILYCTTGILLKYLQSDVDLSTFTHIILDEAHERDVNTDLLMNLLKSALNVNLKLKLIIMSATIDTNLFKNYFNGPPVLYIPGFTYPVESHFLDDLKQLDLSKSYKICANDNEMPTVVHEDVVKVINYIHNKKEEGAILCFLPGWEDISKIQKMLPRSGDIAVLCLHSRLQDSDQRRIFSRTPPGVRKVILSTNIAETSVTIDDVVYVIDTGIHKENRFDNEKGVACIDNYWISQSSMAQRKGRAGRVQPGQSFHLYTRSKYDSFAEHTDPQILKTSLTKIVLNSKVYSNNMDALEFMSQLPTPPEKNATRRAVRELKDLKLLEDNENLTSLGRTLANFQLEPKLAKVLVNSVVYKCVTPVVDIVTLFSADTELFSSSLVDKEGIKRIKMQGSKHSDHLAMMRLFEGWLEIMDEYGEQKAERYCDDANMVHYKLITVSKLRNIHFDYLRNGLHKTLPLADNCSDNDELVKAVLFSGAGNLLRHRNWDIVKGRCKKGDVLLTNYNHKASITQESVNFKKGLASKFLIYFNEVRSNLRRTTLIRESSVIAPIAVLLFSHKDLVIKEIENQSDSVILGFENTGIEFVCSKEDAHQMQMCKEAIDSAYEYFIFQMTEGGESDPQINQVWDKILGNINAILLKHSIK